MSPIYSDAVLCSSFDEVLARMVNAGIPTSTVAKVRLMAIVGLDRGRLHSRPRARARVCDGQAA